MTLRILGELNLYVCMSMGANASIFPIGSVNI